ncbi:MAG: DMT family transporter [Hyphomicrobiales bacterium]
MEFSVFAAVLFAALLHASWNLVVKLALDRFLSLFLIQTIMGLLGLAMVAAFPWPNPACLPYAVASGFIHLGYNLFLARSYRTGDLSQVYPVARGAAPLLTFAGAWMFAGEAATPMIGLGVGLLVAGIWLVTLADRQNLNLDSTVLFYALGTSLFIALYTIIDGLGGRVSGSPSSYAGFVFIFDASFLFILGIMMRGPKIVKDVAPYWKTGVTGAVMSAGAYWIAIWAMSRAPIAAVAALREVSILIVMGMSAYVLKEHVSSKRLIGAGLVVAGAIALRLA